MYLPTYTSNVCVSTTCKIKDVCSSTYLDEPYKALRLFISRFFCVDIKSTKSTHKASKLFSDLVTSYFNLFILGYLILSSFYTNINSLMFDWFCSNLKCKASTKISIWCCYKFAAHYIRKASLQQSSLKISIKFLL